MITPYCSTVLDYPVDKVWPLIRDFNNYPVYIEGVTESLIEDGKRGDEIGAVRRFNYGGNWIRQRLGDHSDERRSLTYVGIDPFALPDKKLSPVHYRGTMHLLPVTEGSRTFIEWSVELDGVSSEEQEWRDIFLEMIPDWTSSLKRTLDRRVD
jgi:hypothetical protein